MTASDQNLASLERASHLVCFVRLKTQNIRLNVRLTEIEHKEKIRGVRTFLSDVIQLCENANYHSRSLTQ